MEVTLQERKRVLLLKDVHSRIAHAKKGRNHRTRDLAALLGRLNFVRLQHPPASLQMRRMQYMLRQEIARGGLEWNGDSQPNDVGRINTLEKDTTRKQTKESEEKEQTGGTNDERFRDGMGCSISNTEGEQRGEDICPRELDPPGECVSDKRKGVQSSVEDFRKEGSMAATTEDRPYSSEDRQHVHEMDNTEEEGSAISHSNTEGIREETEQPGHHNTDGTSSGRTDNKSRCIQPDGEKAGLCTEGGKSLRDIADSRTEYTRYNFRTDCAGALWNYLETILSEKVEGVIELLLNKIVPVCS
ncbi:uncharacterized protein MONOS_15585 [Monocercomonoides exilis]|uniref:uncharacterized protein n=1 Tax=Monocercomonoides exilis TaxID=2049356 RepID=UPI003559EDA2|nr:hypothetical protein MONOS_15585 [Monocercomonoides exilis]|eukprot:MONOS_15585.1-p1 / transcript=MONOS_15585.1 / gene=MONOS_15585 / organism=Monocercomonoides_exilis_PA203 / gene_product=unspecified product / transcript_product=unspecified product / location=Mono_scaffold01280:7789-8691(-) / protein_length=301 / sequence_SO=supercontig / SO=protein_coding / is_pseudo=false